MEIKKITWSSLDIKTLIILVLGGVLIFNIIFGGSLDKNKDTTIKDLKVKNEILKKSNDSLKLESIKIIKAVDSLKIKVEENIIKIDSAEAIKKELKNKRDEIPNYVNRLSADDVANEFTKYLEERTKSNNVR